MGSRACLLGLGKGLGATATRYDDKNDFFKKQPDKDCYDIAQKCKVKGVEKEILELRS